jgi:hypothetical protein
MNKPPNLLPFLIPAFDKRRNFPVNRRTKVVLLEAGEQLEYLHIAHLF